MADSSFRKRGSPYAYVLNNPISFFDTDGRYTEGSGDNWLQDIWDNTTSYSSWSDTGNGSFKGGEIGMPHDPFASFYNFLSVGETRCYTYWTNAAVYSAGSYIKGLDGHSVTIKDNGFWNEVTNKVNQGLEYFIKDLLYFEVSGDVATASTLEISWQDNAAGNTEREDDFAQIVVAAEGEYLSIFVENAANIQTHPIQLTCRSIFKAKQYIFG